MAAERVDSKCGSCNKVVQERHNAILCDGKCKKWWHIACGSVTKKQYDGFNVIEDMKGLMWLCPTCKADDSRTVGMYDLSEYSALFSVITTELENISKNNLVFADRLTELKHENQYIKIQLNEREKTKSVDCDYTKMNELLPSVGSDERLSEERRNRCVTNDLALTELSSIEQNNDQDQDDESGSSGLYYGEIGMEQNDVDMDKRHGPSNTEIIGKVSFSDGNGIVQSNTDCEGNWRTVRQQRGKVRLNKGGHQERIIVDESIKQDIKLNTKSKVKQQTRLVEQNTGKPSYSQALKSKPTGINRVIRGSLVSDENTGLKTAMRMFWMFISGLDPMVNTDEVIAYLGSVDGSVNYVCEKLNSKYESYSSFKVGLPFELAEHFMQPNLWPRGCIVGKYRAPRNNDRQSVSTNRPNYQKGSGPMTNNFLGQNNQRRTVP